MAKRRVQTDPIVSPSDLASRRQGGVVLGGRVIAALGSEIVVADARARITVELASPSPALEPGCLVTCAGKFDGKRLRKARVTVVNAGQPPAATGEYGRFGLDGVGSLLALRARAFAAIRKYFEAEQFVEVDTPIRVRTPGLDAHVDALSAEDGWLITSPEFHMKRLLVGGLPRVFQIVHCFRADEQGPWHEPEFTLLEWYRAFSDAESVMRDTELVVAVVLEALSGHATPTPPLRAKRAAKRSHSALKRPFARMSVRDAFARFANVKDAVALAARDEARYFSLLVDKVEPGLRELRRPVFLTRYPACQAALARLAPDDPTVAERFELYFGGVELCNGFAELTDPLEQERRFEIERAIRRKASRPVYPLDRRFLDALREGMPPSAGNALGVDRLIALALNQPSIARVMPFGNDSR